MTAATNRKPKGFTQITNEILDLPKSEISTHAKLVLIGLKRCAYGTKTITEVSQQTLARRTGISRWSVARALDELQSLGAVSSLGDRAPGVVTKYRLNLDPSTWKKAA